MSNPLNTTSQEIVRLRIEQPDAVEIQANQLNQTSSTLSAPAKTYLQAATSHNTRKAYQADIRHFIQWGGLLPATPDKLIDYIAHHADLLNARTLARRLTALKHWHTYQGFVDPTTNPSVRKTLVGIQKIHGKPKVKATPLTLDNLITLVQALKNSDQLIDHRNVALLLIGFLGAFRRSELVNIQVEHLRFVKEGVEITIPRSKTDQAGEGQYCAIPYGNETLCAVAALKNWLEKTAIKKGYVFRRMTKRHDITDQAIKPGQVNLIIKTLAKSATLSNVELYSSHSLRRGFATEASKKGAPFNAIKRQGRWQHDGTVLGYIEEGKQFHDNAAGFILK